MKDVMFAELPLPRKLPSPDDFYDHVREEIELQLRDNTKVAEAISFKEGKALAQKIALGVTVTYRRAINAPD